MIVNRSVQIHYSTMQLFVMLMIIICTDNQRKSNIHNIPEVEVVYCIVVWSRVDEMRCGGPQARVVMLLCCYGRMYIIHTCGP